MVVDRPQIVITSRRPVDRLVKESPVETDFAVDGKW